MRKKPKPLTPDQLNELVHSIQVWVSSAFTGLELDVVMEREFARTPHELAKVMSKHFDARRDQLIADLCTHVLKTERPPTFLEMFGTLTGDPMATAADASPDEPLPPTGGNILPWRPPR